MCVSVVLLPTTFGVEVGQLFARFATAKVDHTATLRARRRPEVAKPVPRAA